MAGPPGGQRPLGGLTELLPVLRCNVAAWRAVFKVDRRCGGSRNFCRCGLRTEKPVLHLLAGGAPA